jgi:hypothetical protein
VLAVSQGCIDQQGREDNANNRCKFSQSGFWREHLERTCGLANFGIEANEATFSGFNFLIDFPSQDG